MFDKRDRAITYMFCHDLDLTPMFSGLLQEGLFEGNLSVAKSFFKQKVLSHLSPKVCHLLSSSVLLHKLTNVKNVSFKYQYVKF